ncbi:MAG: restriction endonuclease subunit S [Gammaproteobacteria bacterium]|nr:MAG: restriction endonuclease subunit S [Gammaproteobacteria bacterium]
MPEVVGTKKSVGWTTVAFGDVVRQVKDKVDPQDSGLDRFVAGEHMDTDDLRLRRWGEIGVGYLGPAFHMRFKPGHVLYGSRRTYLRKVAVADFEGITANTTYVLESAEPKVLLPELLQFIMQTDAFNEHSVRESRGSVNPYVNFSDLAWFEFNLPPTQVQARIVEVLRAALNTKNRVGDAIYAASQVVTAKLHSAFPVDPHEPEAMLLGEAVELGKIQLKTGPFGTVLAASEYRDSGWPIVNPTEMKNGMIVHNGGPHVDDETASRLETYRLQKGDVLLARKGDFSKAILASEEHAGWVAGSDTIRLRLRSDDFLPEYLYFCIRSPQAKRVLMSHSHGTVMPGLNEKILGSVPIQRRDKSAQLEVVRFVGMCLSSVRSLLEHENECEQFFRSVLRHSLGMSGVVL